TATATPSPTATASPRPSATPTVTPTATPTLTPTPTSTPTPTPKPTPIPSATIRATATPMRSPSSPLTSAAHIPSPSPTSGESLTTMYEKMDLETICKKYSDALGDPDASKATEVRRALRGTRIDFT